MNQFKIYSPACGGSVDGSGQLLSSDLSSQSSIWSQRLESGMQRLVSHENSPAPHSRVDEKVEISVSCLFTSRVWLLGIVKSYQDR